MENQFALEVSQALQGVSNPNRQIADQAEEFFFVQHLNNINLYQNLFNISSNENDQDNLNLKAVIILKKIADKHFSKLDQQIQNVYVNYILSQSIHQKNHQILQIQMQILKRTLQIFDKDKDQNLFVIKIKELFQSGDFDAEKYYALLLMVQVFLNEHQHANKEDRQVMDQFIEQIFPYLNNLLDQLQNADNLTIFSMYSHILSKIFFRAFRYAPASVILQAQFYSKWFNFFKFTLRQQQTEFLKAKKWITRSLLVFYRLTKNQQKQQHNEQIWNDWSQQYSSEFFVIMLEQIFYVKNTSEYNKIMSNISRCFLFYVNENIVSKQSAEIKQIMSQKMYSLVEYNQEQKDLFYDNPVEFLKQNIWNYSDEDVRETTAFLFEIFFKNGLHDHIKQQLAEKLSTPNQVESNLYILQRLNKEMVNKYSMEQNVQFYNELVQQIILPYLQSNDDLVRMRCCALIENIHTSIQNQGLLQKLVEGICNNLQHNQMPVKSFAAIALGQLMKLNIVKEMMKSYLEDLLKIYIDLIKKCNNEQVICSFSKVLFQFQDQIGTYAVDLVQQFLEILINLFEQGTQNMDDIEQKYYSQLETFQAIKLLFKTDFNHDQIVKTFQMIDIVFTRLIQNKMLSQGMESMIEIFTELIQKNQQGNFYQGFWKYFEFFCRAIIEPPAQNQYQNNLLQYASCIETELDLTPLLRLFAYQDKQTLLNNKDEFGVRYIDLLIQCIEKMDKVMSDPSQGMLCPIKILKTDFIWLMKDCNDDTVQKYIQQIIQTNVQNVMDQLKAEKDVVEQQVNWRNFGVTMYFYPQQVQQLLQNNNQSNEFVQIWKQCNYHLMTSTVRLGSFLGLVQLFKHMNVPSTDDQFLEFTILEMVFIGYLQYNEQMVDLEFLMTDQPEDEEEVYEKPEQINTLQKMKQLQKYFEETFIMECEECYVDTENMKCFLENQNLAKLVLNIYPDLLNSENFKNLYDQIDPEIKQRIDKLFSNQLNQQNVQTNKRSLRIRF